MTDAANKINKELFKMYTLPQLEELLTISNRTLLTYIKEGRLKAVKIGGKWLVSEDNLKKFLNGD